MNTHLKIGILGGTFNPVHLGHIELAEKSVDRLGLDKLIFVPAYIPPHKRYDSGIIKWQDRYRMIELAIDGKKGFDISDVEIKRKGASYSINTIKEFKEIYGDKDALYFIAGSDSVGELDTWKDIDELKKLCTFVIVKRPGFKAQAPPEDTVVLELDTPDISATDIRECIKKRLPFQQKVPEKVYQYIIERRLYL
ncbi:MAG: nicotinate-nucleotide adenylyltransferase [Candidatus Omnitrophica bacterium]|nr:nicotinate-nucleotide adenylyltransferase [Candidatus Omnitrophota bacterium]